MDLASNEIQISAQLLKSEYKKAVRKQSKLEQDLTGIVQQFQNLKGKKIRAGTISSMEGEVKGKGKINKSEYFRYGVLRNEIDMSSLSFLSVRT